MGQLGVSPRVVARNGFGQFARDCDRAGQQTVEDLVEEGAQLSRALAPKGAKPDPRTQKLAQSITTRMRGRKSGYWVAEARHAMPQETGARRHTIVGDPDLRFFWVRKGRMFIPARELDGATGDEITVVNHPGNPARPFLRPAYEIVMRNWMLVARTHYPS